MDGSREKRLVRGLVRSLRRNKSVSTVDDLASAMGFDVAPGGATTRKGTTITVSAELRSLGRDGAIALELGRAIAEWAPGLSAFSAAAWLCEELGEPNAAFLKEAAEAS
jgi:hypothetical protein